MDYKALLARVPDADIATVVAFLRVELPIFWLKEYEQQTQRPINPLQVTVGTFIYVYDFWSGLQTSSETVVEDRLIGAFGTSAPPVEVRNPSRMRGWVGPTQQFYGPNRDKGHVFGRALGGGADGPGINIWVQSRAVNQGRNDQGKKFRTMERYCATHPGTFCFSSARYSDQTSQPSGFDFGILLPDKVLWVEEFEN